MFLNMVVRHSALLRKLALNVEHFYVKTIGVGLKIMLLTMKQEKWAISMLQTKYERFPKQLQTKSQNRHFHTPAVNSLLLQNFNVGFAHYDSFRGGGSHIGFHQHCPK